jgi:hypothetical protein
MAARQIVSILLLFSFVTVNFSKVIIWVNYQVNKTEITEKYCINKDKPMMHCCGKCMLKKKLAEDEARQKLPTMPDIKNDIQLFGSAIMVKLNYNRSLVAIMNSMYNGILSIDSANGVFHPPCC